MHSTRNRLALAAVLFAVSLSAGCGNSSRAPVAAPAGQPSSSRTAPSAAAPSPGGATSATECRDQKLHWYISYSSRFPGLSELLPPPAPVDGERLAALAAHADHLAGAVSQARTGPPPTCDPALVTAVDSYLAEVDAAAQATRAAVTSYRSGDSHAGAQHLYEAAQKESAAANLMVAIGTGIA